MLSVYMMMCVYIYICIYIYIYMYIIKQSKHRVLFAGRTCRVSENKISKHHISEELCGMASRGCVRSVAALVVGDQHLEGFTPGTQNQQFMFANSWMIWVFWGGLFSEMLQGYVAVLFLISSLHLALPSTALKLNLNKSRFLPFGCPWHSYKHFFSRGGTKTEI